MFITKKHVHRRTFLRGVGATVALPLLDAMVPAGTALARTAASPVPRFCGIWHPHGASPGYWSPVQAGADFEFSFITKPLEPFRDRDRARQRPRLHGGLLHGGRAGRQPRPRRRLPLRGPAEAGRRDAAPRRHHRPDDREPLGARHPAVVRAARHRGSERQQRQLQLGLQLRLHELGLLVHADHAAADRDQPAHGVRADVRRRGQPRGATGGTAADGQRPRLGRRRADALQEGPRSGRPGPAERLPGERARDRAAHQPRRPQPGSGDEGRGPVRGAREQGRALQADVRPAGDGVPGRHHPLGHADARPRPVREQLPRVGLHRRLARHLAPRRHPGQQGQLRQGEPVPRAEPRLLLREAAEHARRRRHPARPRARLQELEHGQLAPARPREGAGDLVGGVDGTFQGNRHLVFPDSTERTANLLLGILHLYGIERQQVGDSTNPLPIA